MHPYNKKYIKIFEELSKLYKILGDEYRNLAYKKAIMVIAKYPDAIKDPGLLKGIPGIGESIRNKMIEINRSGTLKILEDLKNHPSIKIYSKLIKLNGFTPDFIRKLSERSANRLTNFNDIRKMLRNDVIKLNRVQKLSLKYAEDIVSLIPRREMTTIGNFVGKSIERIDRNAVWEIVGSYRRGNSESKDVDILVKTKRFSAGFMKKLVGDLEQDGVIVGIYSYGNKKFSGLIKLSKGSRVRHLDILYVPGSEWATSLLHFTGSGMFNMLLRQKIKRYGYKLSEKGLWHNGKKIKTPTEESVFRKLGMEYIEPANRNFISIN